MNARGPRRLGASLDGLTPDIAPATPLAAIQALWAELTGPQVAANSAPVALRDGVLIVACSSAPWAQELELLQVEIARALAERLPDPSVVESLRFRVGDRR